MVVRRAALTLAVLVGIYAIYACFAWEHRPSDEAASQAVFGKAPPGLPPVVVDGNAIYSHAREVSRLPSAVTMIGTTAGHGVMYALEHQADPEDVWITKAGRVWEYAFERKVIFGPS